MSGKEFGLLAGGPAEAPRGAAPEAPAATPWVDPPDWFRRLAKNEIIGDAARPLEVDLGCGDGGFLIAMARAHPERDYLGVERLLGRARKVVRRAQRAGLTNVHVLRAESDYVVRRLLPAGAIARMHLLFPDPWPKKRHWKNRLVTPAFREAVHAALEPGGEWLIKSDHREYFEVTTATVREGGRFLAEPWFEGAFDYARTDFESQWLGEGREIFRARFRKVG